MPTAFRHDFYNNETYKGRDGCGGNNQNAGDDEVIPKARDAGYEESRQDDHSKANEEAGEDGVGSHRAGGRDGVEARSEVGKVAAWQAVRMTPDTSDVVDRVEERAEVADQAALVVIMEDGVGLARPFAVILVADACGEVAAGAADEGFACVLGPRGGGH
jgi:hypothetical protein